jgi:hypothetical protein
LHQEFIFYDSPLLSSPLRHHPNTAIPISAVIHSTTQTNKKFSNNSRAATRCSPLHRGLNDLTRRTIIRLPIISRPHHAISDTVFTDADLHQKSTTTTAHNTSERHRSTGNPQTTAKSA